MILQCPSCAARFLVADALIPAEGRTVKCGKCSNQWFVTRDYESPQETAAVEAAAPATPTPDFAAMAEEAYQQTPTPAPTARLPVVKKSKPLLPLKPFKIAVPVLALGWLGLAVFAYFPAAHTAPVLRAVYGLLGVVDTSELVFADVSMERESLGPRTKFILSGSIANHGAEDRFLPQVRVQLKDNENKVIWHYSYPVNHTIKAGEVYPFRIDNVETSFAQRTRSIVMDLGNKFELMVR